MSFFDSINMLTTALEGSGVYQIENVSTGLRYVGSAQCLRKRRNSHWHALRHNKHDNPALQQAWNLNPEQLRFKILFTCPKRLLRFFEQSVLDTFSRLYNINPDAVTCRGRKFSTEAKEKMRQAKLGRKHSEAHKAAIREGMRRGR